MSRIAGSTNLPTIPVDKSVEKLISKALTVDSHLPLNKVINFSPHGKLPIYNMIHASRCFNRDFNYYWRFKN